MDEELPDWDSLTPWDEMQPVSRAPARAAPAPVQTQSEDDTPNWDDLVVPDWDSLQPVDAPPPRAQRERLPPAEGMVGTVARETAHGIVPAIGAIPAMIAGAKAGAAGGVAVAPFLGPVAPIAPIAGGLIGGAAAGIAAGFAISGAQEKALNAAGFDDSAQRAANAKENPTSAIVGELAPNVVTFGSGGLGVKLAERVLGAGMQGGLNLGTQLATKDEIDWKEAGMNAAVGGAFTRVRPAFNRFQAAGEAAGSAITRRIPGVEAGADYLEKRYPPGRPDMSTELGEDVVADDKAAVQTGITATPDSATNASSKAPPKQNANVGNGNGERDGGNDGKYSKRAGSAFSIENVTAQARKEPDSGAVLLKDGIDPAVKVALKPKPQATLLPEAPQMRPGETLAPDRVPQVNNDAPQQPPLFDATGSLVDIQTLVKRGVPFEEASQMTQPQIDARLGRQPTFREPAPPQSTLLPEGQAAPQAPAAQPAPKVAKAPKAPKVQAPAQQGDLVNFAKEKGEPGRPKTLFEDAVAAIRKAGKHAVADQLEEEGPKSTAQAVKLANFYAGAGKDPKNKGELKSLHLRYPEHRQYAGDIVVDKDGHLVHKPEGPGEGERRLTTRGNKERAQAITRALDVIKDVVERFPPESEENVADVRARVERMTKAAIEENGGIHPTNTYDMTRNMGGGATREWSLVHQAKRVVEGKLSPKKFKMEVEPAHQDEDLFREYKKTLSGETGVTSDRRSGDTAVLMGEHERAREAPRSEEEKMIEAIDEKKAQEKKRPAKAEAAIAKSKELGEAKLIKAADKKPTRRQEAAAAKKKAADDALGAKLKREGEALYEAAGGKSIEEEVRAPRKPEVKPTEGKFVIEVRGDHTNGSWRRKKNLQFDTAAEAYAYVEKLKREQAQSFENLDGWREPEEKARIRSTQDQFRAVRYKPSFREKLQAQQDAADKLREEGWRRLNAGEIKPDSEVAKKLAAYDPERFKKFLASSEGERAHEAAESMTDEQIAARAKAAQAAEKARREAIPVWAKMSPEERAEFPMLEPDKVYEAALASASPKKQAMARDKMPPKEGLEKATEKLKGKLENYARILELAEKRAKAKKAAGQKLTEGEEAMLNEIQSGERISPAEEAARMAEPGLAEAAGEKPTAEEVIAKAEKLEKMADAVDDATFERMDSSFFTKTVSRVHEASRQLAQGLFNLRQKEITNFQDTKENILKTAAKVSKEQDERIFNARERDDVDNLSLEDKAAYNRWYKPIFDEGEALFDYLKEHAPDIVGRKVKSHIFRMVKDGPDASTLHQIEDIAPDPVLGFNPNTAQTPNLKERQFVVLENSTGDRQVISLDDDGFTKWNYKKGSRVYDPNFAFEAGETYKDKDGTKWKMKDAYVDEIEEHTDMKYYKNAILAANASLAYLKKLKLHLDYMEGLKKLPEFREWAVPRGGDAKEGWVKTNLKNFDGWRMDPLIAHVLDDYVMHGINAGALNSLRKLSNEVTRMIFWMPTAHMMNVGTHWFVGRGWDWLPVNGNYRRLASTGMRAIKATIEQDDLYKALRDAGMSDPYGGVISRKKLDQFITAAGENIVKHPTEWGKIAKTLGLSSVKDLAQLIYDKSSRVMWAANGMLVVQRVLELEAQGMPRHKAIIEAERDIPNYRVESNLLGTGNKSRVFAQIVKDPLFVAFGPYHYGVLNAYANMIKGFKGTAEEKRDAAGKLMAMGLLAFALKPILDAGARAVTGNEDAEVYPRGPLTWPHVVHKIAQGQTDPSQLLRDTITMSPLVNVGTQVWSGKNFAGKPLVEPGTVRDAAHGDMGAAVRAVGQLGGTVASSAISPLGTIDRAYQKGNFDDNVVSGIGRTLRDQALDIKNPSERASRYNAKQDVYNNRNVKTREKRPLGVIEDFSNWASRQ